MNPLQAILDELSLTSKMFAIYYGAPQSSIRACLSGNVDRIPTKVKNAVAKAGYCTDEIDNEYDRWLKTAFTKGEDLI
ncbi:MAG: hypothetical protein N2645_15175 [Clostridia bacterium]|nr:hypothetical protein [Clostridia bacterium]